MGRQINYYMEIDSFKMLAQKALDLGFVILKIISIETERGLYREERKQYQSLDEIDFCAHSKKYFFHLEEAGEIIFHNSFMDICKSPVIEAGYSEISTNKITSNRLWVSTGYYDDAGNFINRSDILDKKYAALVRYAKKLLVYTTIPLRFPNGQVHTYKGYITPYLLDLMNTTENECLP